MLTVITGNKKEATSRDPIKRCGGDPQWTESNGGSFM